MLKTNISGHNKIWSTKNLSLLGSLYSEKRLGIQGFKNLTATHYIVKCQTESFAAFESSRFVTTKQYFLTNTAFALPID